MAVFRCFLRVLKVACFAFMLCISSAFATTYNITYELNGGTLVSGVSNPASYDDDTLKVLDLPTKSGYVFKGWYESSDFTGDPVKWISANSTVGDKTYYAKWGQFESKFQLTTADSIVSDGTGNKDYFSFGLSASGVFYVDWGDNSPVEVIDRTNDTQFKVYSHTYTNTVAQLYTIKFDGQATGYSKATNIRSDYVDAYYDITPAAIYLGRGNNPRAVTSANEGRTVNAQQSRIGIDSISGSLGAIFPTIGGAAATVGLAYDSIDLYAIQPRFYETFHYSRLGGSIPAELFSGVEGQPARYMFGYMFYYCGITGSIPENLFAGISGTPAYGMFYQTFSHCSNLTGSIPENLFAGISGAPAQAAFGSTFYGCTNLGKDTIDGASKYYIPATLFAGIDGNASMYGFVSDTGLVTSCPLGTNQATTGFDSYFDGKVACVPNDELYCKAGLKYDSSTKACAVCQAGDTCDMGFVQKCPVGYAGNATASAGYDGDSTSTQCVISYTLEYDLNGGTNNPDNPSVYASDSASFVLGVPTKTNYMFKGWCDDAGLTENCSLYKTVDTSITHNQKFYAKWSDLDYKFQVTTTNNIVSDGTGNNDHFEFAMSASGVFYVDWGDNGPVEVIDRTNNTAYTTYSHTYTNTVAQSYTIKFDGDAAGYSISTYSSQGAAISFYNNTKLAGISGSLGSLFPTIGGAAATAGLASNSDALYAIQPRFYQTFDGCSNLTGSIPANLFAGISGIPAERMFNYTFDGCSGLTGSIPENLFAGISGTPAERMFDHTFYGCSKLTGSIPENLFAGISGTPAERMFGFTFYGCSGLTGSIPENLFAGISGAPAKEMFASTFRGCSGLSGSIPANLFAGISGAPAKEMFLGTFYDCTNLGKDAVDGASKYYIPATLFAGIDINTTANSQMSIIVSSTGLLASCPVGTNQAITGFDSYFDGKVACVPNTSVYCKKGELFDTSTHECTTCPNVNACPSAGAVYDCSQFGMAANLNASACIAKYTITYNNMDGADNSPENPGWYTVETPVITLYAPTKPGYDFVGWYDNDQFTGSEVQTIDTSLAVDVTLYAKWQNYTITYELNGGINNVNNPATYTTSGATITLQSPTKANYKFMGWYDNDQFTGDAITEIPSGSMGDIVLYAKWEEFENKFQITTTELADGDTFSFSISAAGTFYVDWGDGSDIETITRPSATSSSQSYSHTYEIGGVKAIKLDGLATGYYSYDAYVSAISFYNNTKLAGISGSLGAIFPTIGGAAATAGYAGNSGNLWAIQPRFYLTFSGCSGLTGSIPENLFAGIQGQPASAMFDYTFYGCSGLTGSIPENLFAGISGAPAGTMFYGTFRGCSGLSGSIPENLFAGISGAPAEYMFDSTFSGCSNLGKDTIDGNNTYYIPPTLMSYSVATNSNYSNGMFSGTGLLTACPSDTIRYYTNSGKVSCLPTDNVICSAGQSLSGTSCAACSGDDCPIRPTLYSCPSGTTTAPSDVSRCVQFYTITYENMDGATLSLSNPVAYYYDTSSGYYYYKTETGSWNNNYGTYSRYLNNPTKTGLSFLGWCEDSALTNCSTYKYVYFNQNQDITLYAKWEEFYDIHYELNGGNWDNYGGNNPNPSIYSNASYTDINFEPQKPGYAFVGWCDDEELTKNCDTFRSISSGYLNNYGYVNGDITFYAKWELQQTTCPAGQYAFFSGRYSYCYDCESGYYCPGKNITGGSTLTPNDNGMYACPAFKPNSKEGAKSMDECSMCPEADFDKDSPLDDNFGAVWYDMNGDGMESMDECVLSVYGASDVMEMEKCAMKLQKTDAELQAELGDDYYTYGFDKPCDYNKANFGLMTCRYNSTDESYTDCSEMVAGCSDADLQSIMTVMQQDGDSKDIVDIELDKKGLNKNTIDWDDFFVQNLAGVDSFDDIARYNTCEPEGYKYCEAGEYYSVSESDCVPCTAGSYCVGGLYATDSATDAGIETCAGDTFSATGAFKCTACPVGVSTANNEHTSCSCAGAGFAYDSEQNICMVASCSDTDYCCEPGDYLSVETDKGYAGCESCLPGSYCEGVIIPIENTTEDAGITSCQDGYYSIDYGATICLQCPTGSTSNSEHTGCECPDGYEWNSERNTCEFTTCPAVSVASAPYYVLANGYMDFGGVYPGNFHFMYDFDNNGNNITDCMTMAVKADDLSQIESDPAAANITGISFCRYNATTGNYTDCATPIQACNENELNTFMSAMNMNGIEAAFNVFAGFSGKLSPSDLTFGNAIGSLTDANNCLTCPEPTKTFDIAESSLMLLDLNGDNQASQDECVFLGMSATDIAEAGECMSDADCNWEQAGLKLFACRYNTTTGDYDDCSETLNMCNATDMSVIRDMAETESMSLKMLLALYNIRAKMGLSNTNPDWNNDFFTVDMSSQSEITDAIVGANAYNVCLVCPVNTEETVTLGNGFMDVGAMESGYVFPYDFGNDGESLDDCVKVVAQWDMANSELPTALSVCKYNSATDTYFGSCATPVATCTQEDLFEITESGNSAAMLQAFATKSGVQSPSNLVFNQSGDNLDSDVECPIQCPQYADPAGVGGGFLVKGPEYVESLGSCANSYVWYDAGVYKMNVCKYNENTNKYDICGDTVFNACTYADAVVLSGSGSTTGDMVQYINGAYTTVVGTDVNSITDIPSGATCSCESGYEWNPSKYMCEFTTCPMTRIIKKLQGDENSWDGGACYDYKGSLIEGITTETECNEDYEWRDNKCFVRGTDKEVPSIITKFGCEYEFDGEHVMGIPMLADIDGNKTKTIDECVLFVESAGNPQAESESETDMRLAACRYSTTTKDYTDCSTTFGICSEADLMEMAEGAQTEEEMVVAILNSAKTKFGAATWDAFYGHDLTSANYTTLIDNANGVITNTIINQDSFSMCCPAGQYMLNDNGVAACDTCPNGSYCAGGVYETSATAGAVQCPAGSVVNNDSTGCDCSGLGAGYHWESSTNTCDSCPMGFYWDASEGTCSEVVCPEGSMSYTNIPQDGSAGLLEMNTSTAKSYGDTQDECITLRLYYENGAPLLASGMESTDINDWLAAGASVAFCKYNSTTGNYDGACSKKYSMCEDDNIVDLMTLVNTSGSVAVAASVFDIDTPEEFDALLTENAADLASETVVNRCCPEGFACCGAGTYIVQANVGSANQCATCEAGSYCPGVQWEIGTTFNSGKSECPVNTYNSTTGATSADACLSCPTDYPLSAIGTGDIAQCYANCPQPPTCVDNASGCAYVNPNQTTKTFGNTCGTNVTSCNGGYTPTGAATWFQTHMNSVIPVETCRLNEDSSCERTINFTDGTTKPITLVAGQFAMGYDDAPMTHGMGYMSCNSTVGNDSSPATRISNSSFVPSVTGSNCWVKISHVGDMEISSSWVYMASYADNEHCADNCGLLINTVNPYPYTEDVLTALMMSAAQNQIRICEANAVNIAWGGIAEPDNLGMCTYGKNLTTPDTEPTQENRLFLGWKPVLITNNENNLENNENFTGNGE